MDEIFKEIWRIRRSKYDKVVMKDLDDLFQM